MPEEDYSDEPLTELEQDQQDTGWFFFLALPEAYPALSGYVDESRGYPIGGAKASTLRGLPPAEDLQVANDESGRLMLRLETWRVTSDDLAALQPYIEQGVLFIVTKEEWGNNPISWIVKIRQQTEANPCCLCSGKLSKTPHSF